MSTWTADFLTSGTIISLSPTRLLIGWGSPSRTTFQALNSEKPAFFISDFFLKQPLPWVQHPEWAELSLEEFAQIMKVQDYNPKIEWQIPLSGQFKQCFDDLQHLLQTGHLKKAVPYIFTISKQLMEPQLLMHCLQNSVHAISHGLGHLYGHWHESSGIIGLTPEFLFFHHLQQPKEVQTLALAGTCRNSQNETDFLKNEKERYEHQVVVQGICQNLKELGTIEVGELQILKLSYLSHLMTPIKLKLHQTFHFESLVRSLHPTPALGAFPLKEGKKWLENFQLHTPRQYYGSPFGVIYPKQGLSCCLVGIRNVQWDSNHGMRIGAGCGVVKQSVFQNEWQEIQLKTRAIRGILFNDN